MSPARDHTPSGARQAGRPRIALSDDDMTVWQRYVADLRALPGHEIAPDARPIAPDPPAPEQAPQTAAPVAVRPPAAPRAPVLSIGVAPAGIDRATWRRFSAGRLKTETRLDLHGHTVDAAFARFERTLERAATDRQRCIEVITGRGSGEQGGILRRELPLWINLPQLRPLILAACYPHEQNQGAVRLLLRRPAPDRRRTLR